MGDSKTSAQNLARIRDNQRRSRARRKEYLQELETKLRSCEQIGVEASAEIQTAARKVLEENRRLRAMLRNRGVPEAEIAAALGIGDISIEQASAAPALMSMLERRWTCGRTSPDQLHIDTQSDSMHSVCQSPTIQLTPLSIPPQPVMPRNAVESYSPSPSSIISSTGSPPSFTSAPFYPMDMTPVSELKAETMPQYGYQFDQPPNNPWIYSNENTDYAAEPVSYYNTTSCVAAANIIRTMRSDVGPELEVDLGCGVPNQDCRVPNPAVFNVMEKYSNPAVRM